MKTTKNIFWVKDEDAINHNTVTRWFKKFHSGYKDLDDQTRLGKLKVMNFKAIVQAVETNPGVALEEYQVSSASHSPVWFINFMTSVKASKTTELCLT